jgi:hypothetical protein
MKYQYIVCFPRSDQPVKAFSTLKAARAFSDSLIEEQQFFASIVSGTRIFLPCIKRKVKGS